MYLVQIWGGIFLMLLLLWRMSTWRAWRFYPAFFWFFALLCGRALSLEGSVLLVPRDGPEYSLWYWYTSLGVDVLRFFVAWEIFRLLAPRNTTAHQVTGGLLLIVMMSLAAFYALLGPRDIKILLEAKVNLSFAAAVWVFVALGAAHYYAIVPGLNGWGIALGTGINAAFAVVNFTALGISESTFFTIRYIRPLGFLAVVLLWLLTLWSYHAPPALPPASAAGDSADAAPAAGDALRKALGLDKK